MKVLITGGHHSSALPVIEEFRAKHSDISLFWIGHRRSLKWDKNDTLEFKEITTLGIPFYDLIAGKVYKTIDPIRLLKVPVGFFQALYYILKIKPDVVLSFGGYLAVPVVIAAWLLGVPSVTHEQTMVAGYANKVIARFAKKILVSWPQSESLFPKSKIVFTGLPIRSSIFNSLPNNFSTENDLPTIFIMGGKTGSHFINELVLLNLEKLLNKYNVIHQCGDNSVFDDFDRAVKLYKTIENRGVGKYFPRKFIYEDEIGEAYSKSALVISRSGAHTVSEILALQKPSILIPIQWSSHNEQCKGAEFLRDGGLAKILEQDKLVNSQFLAEIDDMFSNLEKYQLKNKELLGIFKNNSPELICNETIKTAKKN